MNINVFSVRFGIGKCLKQKCWANRRPFYESWWKFIRCRYLPLALIIGKCLNRNIFLESRILSMTLMNYYLSQSKKSHLLIINDFNELLISGIGNIWKIGTFCFESRNLEIHWQMCSSSVTLMIRWLSMNLMNC